MTYPNSVRTSWLRLCAALLSIAGAMAAVPARANFSPEKLALVDRPFQGADAAIAPDGKHVAFTTLEDERLVLTVLNLERRTQGKMLLTAGTRARSTKLAYMRWATPDRLVLVNSDAEIIAVGPNGRDAVKLWDKAETGLVNTLAFGREPYLVDAGTPRIQPPLADDPSHILIESVATIGAESFSNLYKVDVRTGAGELMNRRDYLAYQIALYGRGDMLLWPPLPARMERWIANPATLGGSRSSLVSLQNYFDRNGLGANLSADSPGVIRSKLVAFMSTPPEGVWPGPFILNGWPASPNPGDGVNPPFAETLTPETGAPVAAESSSTGRMIYDRQGRPRILYTETSDGAPRRFYYFESGKPILEPNHVPTDVDKFLGQAGAKEFAVSPQNYFNERSYPIGFDFDPDILYIASSVGRDTFGIYSLNLRTKERIEMAPGVVGVDLAPGDPADAHDLLVFDEHEKKLVGIRFTTARPKTFWRDPVLGGLQADLDETYPRYGVEILSWDDARNRFLIRMSSEDDPGGIFLFDRGVQKFEQILSSTPWLASTQLNPSGAFLFKTAGGVQLTGYLTLPKEPKITPPPLLIYLEAGLWDRAEPGFNREAEMLADMGVVVMRLNPRGSAGFGRSHLTAIRDGIDAIPIDDLLSAVDWMNEKSKIDLKRVVVMGQGVGGYIAQRAIQLHGDKFRAAISLNAPTNLDAWGSIRSIKGIEPIYRDGSVETIQTVDFRSAIRRAFVSQIKKLPTAPVAPSVSKATPGNAILVIESSTSNDTTPFSSLFAGAEHLYIGGDFQDGTAATRTKVFERIEEFLNLNLYDFGTSYGTPVPVK